MKVTIMTVIMELKNEQKLSWVALSEKCNVSTATMCNWRRGLSEPSLSTVERVLNGLGHELEVVSKE